MKYLFLMLLCFGLNAHSAEWIEGKWEGLCMMNEAEPSGSIIMSYEFSGKTGSLEAKSYEDNRCQKLKSSTKRDFKVKITKLDDKIVQAELEFGKAAVGEIAQATYAFQKYGNEKMGLNSVYFVKQIGKNGKLETLINDPEGGTRYQTQDYTRASK